MKFTFCSFSYYNAAAVPKFISSVLYEGLQTPGLRTGQFNFPRVLITLFKQGKEHREIRDSKDDEKLEWGGGGTSTYYFTLIED